MKKTLSAKIKELFYLFAIFFKIGLFSFGGGYAMLTLIEHEVTDKRKWLTHSELANIFAIAESTPGAISINVATYVGTSRAGIFGGIVATLGVVLPSFAIIVGLSYIINLVENNRWVSYLFQGIRIGVLVLILRAVISFFKDMRKNLFSFALMGATFCIAFLTSISVIYIILSAIAISTLAVAFVSYRKKIYFFERFADAYFNERIGKPLRKDEYYCERLYVENAEFHAILPVKNNGFNAVLPVKTDEFNAISPIENADFNAVLPIENNGFNAVLPIKNADFHNEYNAVLPIENNRGEDEKI